MSDGGDSGPPMGSPVDPGDEQGLSNEDFRLLVNRATYADDWTATKELLDYFHSKIEKKVLSFPRSEQEDVRAELMEVAFATSDKLHFKAIEKPRNYVMRAISNRFVSELRKSVRKRDREQDDQAAQDHLLEVADLDRIADELEDRLIKALLDKMLAEAKTLVARKAAEVVTLTYLLGESERHACALLDFGERETETVLRTIRRWRNDPRSPLHKLLRSYREDHE